jgi:hypothetical protein
MKEPAMNGQKGYIYTYTLPLPPDSEKERRGPTLVRS